MQTLGPGLGTTVLFSTKNSKAGSMARFAGRYITLILAHISWNMWPVMLKH